MLMLALGSRLRPSMVTLGASGGSPASEGWTTAKKPNRVFAEHHVQKLHLLEPKRHQGHLLAKSRYA